MIETDISTLTDRFVYEAYDAATHLIGGLLGEGHSEDPCRVDALSDEMDKAARQGAGLARRPIVRNQDASSSSTLDPGGLIVGVRRSRSAAMSECAT
jgi:hypothetical protein